MKKGSHHTSETKAKLRAANLGKTLSPEHRAKLSAAHKGRVVSPETRAKLSAAQKGKPLSAENRARLVKMCAANKGKPLSPEHRAKLGAAQIGRKHTPEMRAKMSVARKGKLNPMYGKIVCHSEETRRKIGDSHRGMKHTEATRAKMSASHKGVPCPHVTASNKRRLGTKRPGWTYRGAAHWNWRGGASPYGLGFTDDLKRIVRWLYNGRCFLCGDKAGTRELDVHHTDYNKKNNTIDNLVPLCISCHMRTNTRRDYWSWFLTQRRRYFPYGSWELVA